MTTPTRAQVHSDSALTNMSIAYVQSQDSFVADKVFPIMPVAHKSDEYFVFNMGDFNRDEAKERAPATESAGGGFGLTTATFSCTVKAFHKDLPWQHLANADQAVALERAAVDFVTNKMLIAKEKQFVTSFFTGGVWGTDWDGVVSGENNTSTFRFWSDYANSNPIADVELMGLTIKQKTGYRPNKLILGAQVYSKLKNHPDIIERISGGATTALPAKVVRQLMAALFEVEEVLVMDGIENTAKEGQTASNSFIGGKGAALVYAAPAPSIMSPTAGMTFSWSSYIGGAPNGIGMRQFDIDAIEATRVEGAIGYDQKLTAADLGGFFDTIIA